MKVAPFLEIALSEVAIAPNVYVFIVVDVFHKELNCSSV